MKQCSKCKIWKPFFEFHKNPQAKDGYRAICKVCRRGITQAYRAANKIKLAKNMRIYRNTVKGCLRDRFNAIKNRCVNPKNIGYKNYGGRGIQCLFESSDEFVDYALNKLQADPRNLQIDRIDNDGHYKPGNIRFVTRSENLKNRERK